LRLFEAGYLDRFRPMSRRGSLPWTYHLGREGHRLLKRAGLVASRVRFEQQEVYDYRYVLHEIHLNGWVLAYRRELGETLLRWEGETEIEPPRQARSAQLRLDDDWSVEGLAATRPRMIRPDAVLDIAGRDGGEERILLVEYDRTRRVDKNFEKFRRYDSFLVGWWRHTEYSDRKRPPYIVFVCQDEGQVLAFLEAADRQLTGHLWHPSAEPAEYRYAGRDRIVFTSEGDIHEGQRTVHLVAPYPPGHPGRHTGHSYRVVQLPGPLTAPIAA